MLLPFAPANIRVTDRKQALKFISNFVTSLFCCSSSPSRFSKISEDVLQKTLEDERRYPPTGSHDSNNSSFAHDLGSIVQFQNSNGDGFRFKNNPVRPPKAHFWEKLDRKPVYGVSEGCRNSKTPDKTFSLGG
ncbi:hypothetical protein HNY73_014244 [Argiope bruennichi]|uniref:Uncharacterized protein n=1 Tax=Argiope bruennichi TaxID=94029 RepID=A0A8T0ESG2_ARGBR|nr:hypothetical protein HNY73_014244 [Argiope bruennichi]